MNDPNGAGVFTTKPRKVTGLRYHKNQPQLLTGFVPSSYRRYSDTEQTFRINTEVDRFESIYDGDWVVMFMDTGEYAVFTNDEFHRLFVRQGVDQT